MSVEVSVYQLRNPNTALIVGFCEGLEAGERLEVHESGRKNDVSLYIRKDETREETGETVTVNVVREGKRTDEMRNVHITELNKELERIYRNS